MLSNKAKKYLNKEIIIYVLMALVGIVILILGTFFNILKDQVSVCIGLIPVGILSAVLTYRMKNQPEKAEKIIRIKTEERLQFIRYKTGHFAFWIVFIYMVSAAVLSEYILMPLRTFLSMTVVIMALLYLISSIVYHKIL